MVTMAYRAENNIYKCLASVILEAKDYGLKVIITQELSTTSTVSAKLLAITFFVVSCLGILFHPELC